MAFTPKGPVVAFLGAVVGAFVAGITTWIFLEQHINDRIENTVPEMVKNGKIKLPSPLSGPPGPAFDLKTAVIQSIVHLRFLNLGPPDSVDDLNLIRDTSPAEKVLTIKELSGRRIVALSWEPVGNLGALANFSSLKFEQYGTNQVKISAATVGDKAAAVEFVLRVFHVPSELGSGQH